MKKLILLCLLCSFWTSFSQDMQAGFDYLESGNFKSAETFFFEILKNQPENRTAQLCYARAIGLQGQSQNALDIFKKLLIDYPDDYEIKLNYAEALLWNKNYTEAKTYYEALLKENQNNFSARLGYANTLSNLKRYPEALSAINSALELSPGNSTGLISKKYIHLGYADQLQKNQDYNIAESILNKNLELFSNDAETLKSLANLYLIKEEYDRAYQTYELLMQNPEQKIDALNGKALVWHLRQRDKKALALAEASYSESFKTENASAKGAARERYAQALIWNRKYQSAKGIMDTIQKEYPTASWAKSLVATYAIYKSDFGESLENYDALLESDQGSFDGNLGKANALKGLKRYNQAYYAAQTTLGYHKNQKDALFFIENLNLSFAPHTTSNAYYSIDNADNEAFSVSAGAMVPLSTDLKLHADYNYRTTENKNTSENANSNQLTLGASYRFSPVIAISGNFGYSFVSADETDFNQFVTKITAEIEPAKLQNIQIGFEKRLQDFNANLLTRKLTQDNYFLNYNLATNFNLGWYFQYFHTRQNDDNVQNLIFSSIYYNISNTPLLKGGINYQYITFKNQLPAIYFSPENYHALELFMNLFKSDEAIKPNTWYYNITGATGIQFIENQEGQNTYRIQLDLGYKFSQRTFLSLNGLRSNIASATAAGFTYNQIGLTLKWYLDTNPIFVYKKR